MQPRFTQVPPSRLTSATAARAPKPAATRLARTPPEPAPIVKRSKSKPLIRVCLPGAVRSRGAPDLLVAFISVSGGAWEPRREASLSCRETLDFLAAYLDGELAASVRSAFEDHLSVCAACVDYLESYRETIRLAHAAVEVDAGCEEIPAELVRATVASARAR